MFRQLLSAISLSAIAVTALAIELTDEQRAAIEERIKPVGHVCVKGEACMGSSMATAVAAAADTATISGEAVYNQACVACHSSGAGGAPIVGNVDQWSVRIAKGRDALHSAGVNGVAGTGMMAKGGRADLSDQQVMAAVDYMIDNSQ